MIENKDWEPIYQIGKTLGTNDTIYLFFYDKKNFPHIKYL